MPADSISNCQCLGRYGRDEIAGKRATRGISSSSYAKRIAVFYERTSKEDIVVQIMRRLPVSDYVYFCLSSCLFLLFWMVPFQQTDIFEAGVSVTQ